MKSGFGSHSLRLEAPHPRVSQVSPDMRVGSSRSPDCEAVGMRRAPVSSVVRSLVFKYEKKKKKSGRKCIDHITTVLEILGDSIFSLLCI